MIPFFSFLCSFCKELAKIIGCHLLWEILDPPLRSTVGDVNMAHDNRPSGSADI